MQCAKNMPYIKFFYIYIDYIFVRLLPSKNSRKAMGIEVTKAGLLIWWAPIYLYGICKATVYVLGVEILGLG